MLELVDSHAHLDLLNDPAGVIDSARAAGVGHIVAVGSDLQSSRKAIGFARGHDGIFASVGVHPHDASSFDEQVMGELEEMAGSDGVVAVGETGLDYYRDLSPRKAQANAFSLQIELARMTGRALIVHSRDAPRETLETLKREAADLTVILHCFSLYDHLDECAEAGYYMSFAGNVTFKKAEALRRAARVAPAGLLLTETDCPYLSPHPYRGQRNRPENVRLVLEEIARLRGVETGELATQIVRNFQTAFHINGAE